MFACHFCHALATATIVVSGLTFYVCDDAARCTAYGREWRRRDQAPTPRG